MDAAFKRAADWRVGDVILRHSGRTATLVSVEVVPVSERYRVDGIWMVWSDGVGPFVADPEWKLLEAGRG